MNCNENDNYCEDFIRVYEKAVSPQFCRGIIDFFEWSAEHNRTWERQETTPIHKKDLSTSINPKNFWEINFVNEHLSGYIDEFNTAFWDECYPSYVQEFDTLRGFPNHTIFTYKIQKTLPAEGYHVWHCEHSSMGASRRIGVYILYLNDVAEGGETEFLYQRKRIQPKEGMLCIFPASYTHTHRGNPPLRGKKYVMTGWIEFN